MKRIVGSTSGNPKAEGSVKVTSRAGTKVRGGRRGRNPQGTVRTRAPEKQGLYDPQFEHESCGVGFVVNIKGRKSHAIIRSAIQVLLNLDHRGACGCEANTGDGAGILIQPPHDFLKLVAREARVSLPSPGEYGVGMVFLPSNRSQRSECEKMF